MLYGLMILIILLVGIIIFIVGMKLDNCWDDKYVILIILGIMLISFCWLPSVTMYRAYTEPMIDLDAHNYCQEQGFDTFESWTGKGIFPEKPLFIKCKYVDNQVVREVSFND